ncbi:hypothetical protein PG996_013959 [Apiospora saccharicola]|uniref:Zn(2)-C6 fungal-type domain-containing protein n=1 Tax=Apiospora saccharicola TaxID=335842 RepID=A0ABR1TGZ1_9PEZI
MYSQYQGVPMTDASSFADSPDLRLMLFSAPPPQEPVGTPWHYMSHEPTMAQSPPLGHAGGEAISNAIFEFYPYPSPLRPTTPACYDDTHNNHLGFDSLVEHATDLTAADHEHEDVFQSDPTSTAQTLNPSFSMPDSSTMQTTNMATGLRLSMDLSPTSQDESEWQFVEKEQVPKYEKFGPEAPPSSGRASPIDGPWQCIPHYLDQPRQVFSSYTAYGTSSPEALDQLDHGGPTMLRRPKKRGALSPEERQQTSKTRRITACLRCQMQRKRCLPNPDPEDDRCLTCSNVNPSKKVIHHMVCVRWKLTAATVYRQAHLQLTKRWRGNTMYDIPSADWADDEIRVIQISEGLCSKPFEIKVRRFKPQPGDVTDRLWTDKRGISHTSKLPPYAIASVGETCKAFVKHAEENTFEAVEQFASRHDVHPIVQETYKAAWNHMRRVTGKSGHINLPDFMKELWGFWFVLRHTIGSSEIVGDEHLGMKPETHKEYPFPPGHLSVPRMVCQQFTSIVYDTLLRKKRAMILKDLWALMQSKNPNCFETVYFAVFILLHEISATSKDRFRWSRENQVKARYDIEESMEGLHEGANIILCMWTYYRRGLRPVDVDWDTIRKSPPKAKKQLQASEGSIESETERPVSRGTPRYTMKRKEVRPEADRPFVWERDMHFTSQMFQADWHAQKQWQRWND